MRLRRYQPIARKTLV